MNKKKKKKSTFNLCNPHSLLGSSSYPPQAGTCHKPSGTSTNTFGAGELALVLCNMKHSADVLPSAAMPKIWYHQNYFPTCILKYTCTFIKV